MTECIICGSTSGLAITKKVDSVTYTGGTGTFALEGTFTEITTCYQCAAIVGVYSQMQMCDSLVANGLSAGSVPWASLPIAPSMNNALAPSPTPINIPQSNVMFKR